MEMLGSWLPDHAETIVDEIGEYFIWAWPFFDAAMTGVWRAPGSMPSVLKSDEEESGDVDETAPKTIGELAEITALPEPLLYDIEEALWAKRQVILVGPPGTSKTFIARQFARYFVRQRQGQPQGSFDVLYMHANWRYEDFFEGLFDRAVGLGCPRPLAPDRRNAAAKQIPDFPATCTD